MSYFIDKNYIFFLIASLSFFTGCKKNENKLFTRIDSNHSGIAFKNSIQTNDSLNILSFEYIYNGGGVGTADFNNDGLIDIFFAGNKVSSKLYINKGDFKFQDITEKAGLLTTQWCTGVSIVDINKDGLMDIYISTIHPFMHIRSENYFFINKGIESGIPRFENMAKQMNINSSAYSTQAAFFDYDLDGDDDMYLCTNSLETYNRNLIVTQQERPTANSVDLFFENKGTQENGLPSFDNVSSKVGLNHIGWGLGVIVNDFNNDGYPDVYVSNDFMSNDHLYINNRNKTFTDSISYYFIHTSTNSMGVDMSDLNNDGLNDLVAVDMLPDDNLRKKTMFGKIDYDYFHESLAKKYMPQVIKNVLQLNNGNGTFSDIGNMAGISATDWSWAPLIADFDLDGNKDIFISNGYKLDITDLDFVSYRDDEMSYGNPEEQRKKLQEGFKKLKGVFKHNYFYKNEGNLKWSDQSVSAGLDEPSYSNGVAYADFDNDGDLDLVINNLDSESFLYRNNTINNGNKAQKKFVKICFTENGKQSIPVGAKVKLFTNTRIQYDEFHVVRGYKSSMHPNLIFGLDNNETVDSLIVVWKDRSKTYVGKNLAQKLTVELTHLDGVKKNLYKNTAPLYKMTDNNLGIDYVDEQEDYNDYLIQHTLLMKFSEYGPAIEVKDLNQDGREDVVVGGAAHKPSYLYIQKGDKFKRIDLGTKDEEVVDIVIEDIDGDSDQDIYMVSGSSEFALNSGRYQDFIYYNDGKGNFKKSPFPIQTQTCGGSVTTADFDKDGDIDIFRSGKIVPNGYPSIPQSYFFLNDGKGNLSNQLSQEEGKLGNINTVVSTDLNNDGFADLVYAGDFMPITIIQNSSGKLLFNQPIIIPNTEGLWQTLFIDDFDNDGRKDILAGNIGTNIPYVVNQSTPLTVYAKDLDNTGSYDALFSYWNYNKEYPIAPRGTMIDQLISTRRRYKTYADYGRATMDDFLPVNERSKVQILRAVTASHYCFFNDGNFKFSQVSLPEYAQISTINSFLKNGDYILYAGNNYAFEVLSGRIDASIGGVLNFNSNRKIEIIAPDKAGLKLKGQVRDLKFIKDFNTIVAATTKDKLQFIKPNK